MDAGYSGTPLPKKLGLKPPLDLVVIGAPPEYASWIAPIPNGVRLLSTTAKIVQAAHVFATERRALETTLAALRRKLEPAGFVWVSWPKKSAKVPTDITEDTIREIALPLGFVDIKVCAVSEVWSGLKLVIRVAHRK
jgi:hypothetical protein